ESVTASHKNESSIQGDGNGVSAIAALSSDSIPNTDDAKASNEASIKRRHRRRRRAEAWVCRILPSILATRCCFFPIQLGKSDGAWDLVSYFEKPLNAAVAASAAKSVALMATSRRVSSIVLRFIARGLWPRPSYRSNHWSEEKAAQKGAASRK